MREKMKEMLFKIGERKELIKGDLNFNTMSLIVFVIFSFSGVLEIFFKVLYYLIKIHNSYFNFL